MTVTWRGMLELHFALVEEVNGSQLVTGASEFEQDRDRHDVRK